MPTVTVVDATGDMLGAGSRQSRSAKNGQAHSFSALILLLDSPITGRTVEARMVCLEALAVDIAFNFSQSSRDVLFSG